MTKGSIIISWEPAFLKVFIVNIQSNMEYSGQNKSAFAGLPGALTSKIKKITV